MTANIPCIALDEIRIPAIPLPTGGELKGVADFAAGIPTNCKIDMSLLIQLGPLLGAMGCILKILEVLGNIIDFAKAAPDPFKMAEKVGALVKSFEELSGCIPALAPFNFVLMIKAILELIINILSCLVDSLASIVEFQVSIDFASAEGNPALLAALECAQRNADTSMSNLMNSMGPIETVMKVVGGVAALAQLDIALPDLSALGQAADAVQAVQQLKQSVDALKAVVDALPG
ncbi:hypothetical protein [Pseudoduganella umbonata]|uniref:Uncharacterized protein n=1 Tax=Pseudoduganella umbonata TaxID=864828 RepID=A0A4P8HJT3_9BURK|nr:hypothetical protein [Pseudoduganella umbonata]MBB3219832.1 hypothetical protein [Pseudoduganella umbonata]QCP09863.1 hypothetical protein FCL38_05070 [Pseudoduganella umbonata]